MVIIPVLSSFTEIKLEKYNYFIDKSLNLKCEHTLILENIGKEGERGEDRNEMIGGRGHRYAMKREGVEMRW